MKTAECMLASPLTLRHTAIRNRVMISPMCMYSATNGVVGDFHLVHLGRFALGGAGLVFVEATAVNEVGRITTGCVGLWNDEQEAALRRVATMLRSLGSCAGIQLNHAGRKGSSEKPWEGSGPLSGSKSGDATLAWQTVSVTEDSLGRNWPACHALTPAEIDGIVQDFARAAKRADAAGFDVIEVHLAHGYLLHQFLSPIANTRTDAYGGSLENRMRFPMEVVRAVRRVWPQGKPLFARISSVDGIDIGWSLDDSITLSRELQRAGVDVIDCSSGGMKLPREKQLLSRTPGFHVPYAEAIRQATGLPTVAVGLIRDPAHAEAILAGGQADLIAVAREALFNPNWAQQAVLAFEGQAGWAHWPEQHGWWLERRAEQQGDAFEHLKRFVPSQPEPPMLEPTGASHA